MIGTNFTLSSDANYQPLQFVNQTTPEKFDAPELPRLSPASLFLLEELQQVGIDPCDYGIGLSKELSQWTFHIIANQIVAAMEGHELIETVASCDVWEFEPLDIKRNPDKAAWAVQNQAFVALKEGSTAPKLKFPPLLATLVEEGKVKQFDFINDEGAITQSILPAQAEICRFTPEEVDQISKVVLKGVSIAHQIRSIEQQLKKDRAEFVNKERQFWEGILIQQMLTQAKNFFSFSPLETTGKRHTLHLRDILKAMLHKKLKEIREEAKQQEKEEIARSELKRQILRHLIQQRTIQQNELRRQT